MKPPELQKDKKESLDSEDLDVTCDSSCGMRYHIHNHLKYPQPSYHTSKKS